MKVRIGEREYEFDSVAEAVEFEGNFNRQIVAKPKPKDISLGVACPQCNSHDLQKYGFKDDRQVWRCKDCGRRFTERGVIKRVKVKEQIKEGMETRLSEAIAIIKSSPIPIGTPTILKTLGFPITKERCNALTNFIKENMHGIREYGNKYKKYMNAKIQDENNIREQLKTLKTKRKFTRAPSAYNLFLSEKIKYYTTRENMRHEDAFKTAVADWNKKKASAKTYEPVLKEGTDSFPKVHYLNDSQLGLLKDVLKNLIFNKGEMTLPMDGEMIGIHDKLEWHNFIEDLLIKSGEICNYFKVSNRFKVNPVTKSVKYGN